MTTTSGTPFIKTLLSLLFSALFFQTSFAQTNDYISAVDQEVAVKKIVILPFQDNTNGIYSKKMEEVIRQQVENDHQYEIITYKAAANSAFAYAPDYLAETPAEVLKLKASQQADTLIAARITQGPQGIQAKLAMFHGPQGLMLAQSEVSNIKIESTKNLEDQFVSLYKNLKSQFPFQGTIVSRNGNSVTVNIGRHHGAQSGDAASVIQLLKLNRHPKYKFLVGSDKEVLGKIRLTQVDEFLSFGTITMEKEAQLLHVGQKVAIDRFIQYQDPGKNSKNLNDPAFGENPQEWTPPTPPQYGRVQLLGGISQYTQSATLKTAGNLSADSNATPNIIAFGEMWFNKNIFLQAEIQQAIFSVSNPLGGASPGKLNMSYAKYNIFGVYNIPLAQEFFGPRIQLLAGIHRFQVRADESTPIAFTNMEYGGLAVGLAGAFPVTEKIDIGLQFKLFLTPSVSESSSVNSGSAGKPTINTFGIFGGYKLNPNFNVVGRFDLDYYSSDFDPNGTRPDPATTINHKIMGLYAGVEYLF